MKPLGETQTLVIDSLKRGGGFWYPGCGWLWDTRSGTIRIMESLLKRGVVKKEPISDGRNKYILNEEYK